jgi:hypothetical protein
MIALGCVSLALLIALGVWGYRHYWAYYRLFFANTAGEMRYQDRVHALARGGTDALSMMIQRISDDDPGAEQLALDALETMHSDTIGGPQVLYQLMSQGNEDALNMVAYIALRARLDRYRHLHLYQEYHPDRVLEAVEQYTNNYSNAYPSDLGRRALAALRAEYGALVKAATIRRYKHSLSPAARRALMERMEAERDTDSKSPATVFDQNGAFQGQHSLLLIRYIALFTTFLGEHPELTDEQAYEVASIFGNDLRLNARYFFDLYRQGIPDESGIVVDPGFDYAHTGDNLASVK